MRELKGLEIAARFRITPDNGTWLVPSQSGNGKYRVTTAPASCTCEDFTLRKEPCKHGIAARLVQERDHGGKAPAIVADVVPKRPTYRQNGPAYDLAQATEKRRFQVLLHDLCRGSEEPPPPKCGRRPHLFRDAIFALTYKVYSTFSGRRFSSDLLDAHERGYITRPIPGIKACHFLENPALGPILEALITQSALPRKAVEFVGLQHVAVRPLVR